MKKDNKPRVLEESSDLEKEKVEVIDRPDVIFRSGLNATIRLENYKSEFMLDGINLYDDGRTSLISSAMYN